MLDKRENASDLIGGHVADKDQLLARVLLDYRRSAGSQCEHRRRQTAVRRMSGGIAMRRAQVNKRRFRAEISDIRR